MNLIRARERYEVKAKFTTWLYQMAHNRVIDHYRRQKNVTINSSGESNIEAEQIPARVQDQPDHQAESLAKTDRLLELIDNLPEQQQETFLLREEVGMSIDEIAETTGVKHETAKSRLRYAVNKLREGLREYESG